MCRIMLIILHLYIIDWLKLMSGGSTSQMNKVSICTTNKLINVLQYSLLKNLKFGPGQICISVFNLLKCNFYEYFWEFISVKKYFRVRSNF